jgi:16S rRNA (uracil1498-N3)-methyltransferase
MGHVPHLVVAAPWESEELELSLMQWRHLTKVLRMGRGETVTYTDGLGRLGTGRLMSQALRRGEETMISRPSDLTVAVAPPSSKDRQRYLVEKLAELGVARLRWLGTKHGKERTASSSKVFAWTLAATEQSRGAWLMETPKDVVELSDLESPVLICHPGGDADPAPAKTVVIGPEGGFAPEEIPEDARLWDLGPTILRVETAAVVAAARIISQ